MARLSAPDGYIAIVRIERNDEVSAQLASAAFKRTLDKRGRSAARCGRVSGAIDRGVLGAVDARGTLAT
ncbi:hypothetical protein WT26_00980 [Burkholderia cepacia]|uniref:Uncharacterized protein n=1 Tax=Burkholderia cepacia TaxID=292 RepID=A0A1B4PL52_BURCE|nr:hypothetical protein [Burkholderia cepacia]AOK14666.1 hypothetical protein WT26_00980 [Burkholderia cepacia]